MYENVSQLINPQNYYCYRFYKGKTMKGQKRNYPRVHKCKRNIVIKLNPQNKSKIF